MGTVVELSIGWMTLTTTSNEMTRSTKSIDICLILFFLVVTMKNKYGRVKQKREKKPVERVFSRKLAVRDDQLSGLPEGHHLHRQGII